MDSVNQELQEVIKNLEWLKSVITDKQSALVTDFKSRQRDAVGLTIERGMKNIERHLEQAGVATNDLFVQFRMTREIGGKIAILRLLSEIIASLPESRSDFSFPNIHTPSEIESELVADVNELKKCFGGGCFRSAVILCGRILETALHRKYFEATGNDLLEKSPGIGLGNLIARMDEKGIALDPGLPNQIHLINQVRIYSVHKKQDAFYPTKNQAQAIILYTFDVIERLFMKK